MIIKINPDKQKAEALRIMATLTLKRLEETNLAEYPSNTLTDYYDSIHKLMEAFAFREGIKVKGKGAHQELIDYISKLHHFDEQTRLFLQQMRDYRNRISYEGFMINKNYVLLNEGKIKTIIKTLFDKLKS